MQMQIIKDAFKRIKEAVSFCGSIFLPNLSRSDIDTESEGWSLLAQDAREKGSLTEEALIDVRHVSQFLFYLNPYYKGIIRQYIKYCTGRRFSVTSDNEREQSVWDAWKKETKFRTWFKELVRRFFRDGEVFIHLPFWSFINPDLVRDPGNADYGIEIDPDTCEPIWYHIEQETGFVSVPASEIIHIKSTDSDVLRGEPYLLPIMLTCHQYRGWLNDRLLLNKIRSSIALLRKHSAGPTKISTFADAKKTTTNTAGDRVKTFKAGSIMDVGNVDDYKFLAPNVQAKDVGEDGRNLRLTLSAMTGLPEFITSGDASNSNFASTMVSEGPGEKEIEDWQDFFHEAIDEIWIAVQKQGDEILARAKENNFSMPEVNFPVIISRNALDETKRDQILHDSGVISTLEWQRRERVDSTKMDEELQLEDATLNADNTDQEDGESEDNTDES